MISSLPLSHSLRNLSKSFKKLNYHYLNTYDFIITSSIAFENPALQYKHCSNRKFSKTKSKELRLPGAFTWFTSNFFPKTPPNRNANKRILESRKKPKSFSLVKTI